MTVNLAIENPDYYAAIFPICQAYQSEWIDDDDLEKLLTSQSGSFTHWMMWLFNFNQQQATYTID